MKMHNKAAKVQMPKKVMNDKNAFDLKMEDPVIDFGKDYQTNVPIEHQNLFKKIQSDNTLMKAIPLKPPMFFKTNTVFDTNNMFTISKESSK